jgi:hypothetical protein
LEWRRAKDEGGSAREEAAADAAASQRFVGGPVSPAPPTPKTAGFLGRV